MNKDARKLEVALLHLAFIFKPFGNSVDSRIVEGPRKTTNLVPAGAGTAASNEEIETAQATFEFSVKSRLKMKELME